MTKRTLGFASLALIAAACSQNMGSDAGDARVSNDARADARGDVASDRPSNDVVPTTDAGDASMSDGTSTDDVPVSDDVPVGTDVPATDDVLVAMDVSTTTDVPVTGTDVPAGIDTGSTDDVPTSCGPAPTLTVTSPPTGTIIETCSRSDMPIYYDFTVQATGSITDVQVNWLIDGSPFAAPWNLSGGPTFTAHKQVGGLPTSTEQPLTRAANALTGSWQFTAIGTDACGRTVMTSRAFSLEYTRPSRCPNP